MNSGELRLNLETGCYALKDQKDDKPIRQLVFQLWHELQEAKEKEPQIIYRPEPNDKIILADLENTVKQLRTKLTEKENQILSQTTELGELQKHLFEHQERYFKPLNILKEATTEELIKLCIRSIELHFDHVPKRDFFEGLYPDGTHVAGMTFLHSPDLAFWHSNKIPHNYNFAHNNGFNIRAEMWCRPKEGTEPIRQWCDFDEEMFMKLKDVPEIVVAKLNERRDKRRSKC